MNTGTSPNTLKERLQQKTQEQISKTEDSINTILINFVDNFESMLAREQNIMESAIQIHLEEMQESYLKRKFSETRWNPPRWLIASLMMGAISLSAWGIFAINRQTEASRFEEMGIYLNQTGETPLIIVDPKRLSISNCKLSGNVYYCLKPKED